MIDIYKSKVADIQQLIKKNKKIATAFALSRLLLVGFLIVLLLQYFKSGSQVNIIIMLLLLGGFLILITYHQKVKSNISLYQHLLKLNEEEIIFLEQGKLPFDDGKEFIDTNHLYTFDLDIFGKNSLYQYLNRTSTSPGKKYLAKKLSNKLSNEDIQQHQISIKELSEKIDFRQLFIARARLAAIDDKTYQLLIQWSSKSTKSTSKVMIALSYLFPVAFFSMLCLSIVTQQIIFIYLCNTFFLLNLSLLMLTIKKIKSELIEADKIHDAIKQYAIIFDNLGSEKFSAPLLNAMQLTLQNDGKDAFKIVKKLSSLLSELSSIENPLATLIFNGAMLYHLNVYHRLILWKKLNVAHLTKFLEILAEFDALISLSNFAFNNSGFTYPEINSQQHIIFENIGHPLIKHNTRISNDISFKSGSFIILTGSNMSGKSTFLRTLGINMVLAGTGAPVCASAANIHPLNVIVSMRVSDSLHDGNSYFFAEISRLKQIMNALEQEMCFVLLDEILKGTNSDDKRLGTLSIIEKMVSYKAVGVIATHDLEVCSITQSYPKTLSNYCFEAEIDNNELVFNYKLNKGICKNKSASFLLKKMGVI